MIAGHVGKIRELERGIEAEVCVGVSAEGTCVIKVTASSPRVKKAVEALRAALREEAHAQLVAAQHDQLKRGRKAIGVES